MPGYEPKAYVEASQNIAARISRGVAAVFTMVLQHRDYLDTLDLGALRGMTIGSAVVTPELLDAVERALPHIKVSESYGLTEGGSPFRAPIDGRPVPRGSLGVQAPDIEVRLIDADGQRAPERRGAPDPQPLCLPRLSQPAGDHGARSSSMAGCAPATSSARTQTDSIYFRSRVDDMFSCGGENVYPKEVENVLFAHPDVVNAVVAPVPHPVKGFVPAAMVIARAGLDCYGGGAQAHCLDRIGLFASTLYRHRGAAAAQRRRQDRPQRGAGQAQRRLCGGERRRRTVGEAKRSVRRTRLGCGWWKAFFERSIARRVAPWPALSSPTALLHDPARPHVGRTVSPRAEQSRPR